MSVDVHSQSPNTIAVVRAAVVSSTAPVVTTGFSVVLTSASLVVAKSISLVLAVATDSPVVTIKGSCDVKNGVSDVSIAVVISGVSVETKIFGVVDDSPFKQP